MNPFTMTEAEFEALALKAMEAPTPARAPIETPEEMKALGFSFGSLLGMLGPYSGLIFTLLEQAGLKAVSASLPKLREYVEAIQAERRLFIWIKDGVLAMIDAMIASPMIAANFFGE
jgi:hypothetical protein